MNLTDEQRRAMCHETGPALVLAVPGSGKTTMLLSRTKRLIDRGIDRRRILTITFSKASTRDLRVRYADLFGEKDIPSFSTIHGFCYSVLKNYERRSGIRYTLIESTRGINKWRILTDLWKALLHRLPNEDQIETLIEEISYVKNKMLDPEAFQRDAQSPLFLKFYTRYEALKKERLWIDFDDMITLTLEIFNKDPGLLRAIQKTYDYVQVDEGQDTSKGQLLIIDAVISPHRNLFIVADDDQAIYSFRGADFRELLALPDRYPDLKTYYLSKNFRSSSTIVEMSTRFIAQNRGRYDKTPVAVRPEGPEMRAIELNTLDKQYEYILSEIEANHLNDVAVLYRNHISAIGLVECLERHQVPFTSRRGGLRFFHHWVLNDLMTIYRFAEDPSDLEAFSTFYYKIRGYISKKMIAALEKKGVASSVFDSLLEMDLPDYMRRDLKALKRDFLYLKDLPPREGFRFIQKDLEYEHYIRHHAATFGSSAATSMRILYYAKYIAKKSANFDEFLGRLKTLDRLLRGGAAAEPGLVLSTLHGAKGLEFDAVFLIDLNDDTIPAEAKANDTVSERARALEEERRLFYVGMTRAKNRLYFLRSKKIDREATSPSPFYTWAKKDIVTHRKKR
ncbi:MAG: ATP-dependent helicase [Peptoniphilus sp.]|nr:ATP-dependent helicase [Peptoniphilus sp.]MDD7362825.1 ATP-dependent helicase [Bacillota bacterium]MDY6043983.1 ATP-dependent helicase [Peptoniphilus sp.]